MLSKLLENIYDDKDNLEKLAFEIDKSIYNDSTAAIFKGRLLGELLSKRIASDEGLDDLINFKQVDRINQLFVNNIITREVNEYFNIVRKTGNKAVHDTVEGELESALKIHRNLYKIITWYIQNYIKADFKGEPYKTPSMQSQENEDSGMIKKMFNELKGLLLNNDSKGKDLKLDKTLEVYSEEKDTTKVLNDEEIKEKENIINNDSCYLEFMTYELKNILQEKKWNINFNGEEINIKNIYLKNKFENIDTLKGISLEVNISRPINTKCNIDVNIKDLNNINENLIDGLIRRLREEMNLDISEERYEGLVFRFKFNVLDIKEKLDDTKETMENNKESIKLIIGKFVSIFNDDLLEIWSDKIIKENISEETEQEIALDIIDDTKDIINEVKESSGCLVKELNRLKESSKEAVEGLESFSEFKQYMHVERTMHRELEHLIKNCAKSDFQKLILVCGSAGDGKSHIISYFKNKYPQIMREFKLWNDATESLDPKKTAMDTLNDVLSDFNDENIDKNKEKLILAINLGTLNNFIDSKYGENFTKLRGFVTDKKILESTITENLYDDSSSFQFVNFGDYHMYELESEKTKSEYISNLIKKVTNNNKDNVFYKSYCENCLSCKNKDCCPIKLNYEYLNFDEVRENIVALIIEAIIKNKLLITTRALLNFIFDIIVGKNSNKVDEFIFKNKIANLNENEYIEALLPNILFDRSELSFVFEAIKKLDPLNIRNNELDDFVVEFNTSDRVFEFFNNNIRYPDKYLMQVENKDLAGTKNDELRDKLLALFIRSFALSATSDLFNLEDKIYSKFIQDLYNWNKCDKSKLKDLYVRIKTAIMKWNGESDQNEINIFIGKNQLNYKISEEINIRPDLSNLTVNNSVKLEKFLDNLRLMYKVENSDKSYVFEIDFDLYETLQKVLAGYRANKLDKAHYIKFVETLENIIALGSQKEKMFFTEKNREENKKYILEYDEDFGGFSFMEVDSDGK